MHRFRTSEFHLKECELLKQFLSHTFSRKRKMADCFRNHVFVLFIFEADTVRAWGEKSERKKFNVSQNE